MPLSYEDARAQLESFQVSDHAKRRARRIKALPAPSQTAARLFTRDDGVSPWAAGNAKEEARAVQALERLRARERQALFEALLPGFGPHLEAMWLRGFTQPYQAGWQRRAFRAPTSPTASLDARVWRARTVVDWLAEYESVDPVWVARWAAYLGYGNTLGHLLAAVIDSGDAAGREVFDVLVASGDGTDPVASMGGHVIVALLSSGRQDGWEYVERLLLAAQRQEGLRQAILENVDEASPDAFRRMLGVIREHGLVRFSATVRAADVWFGFEYDVGVARKIEHAIECMERFLADSEARSDAVAGDDPEAAYLGLWALAHEDVALAIPIAAAMLENDVVERRFVAAAFLLQVGLAGPPLEALATALDDADLRVASLAAKQFRWLDPEHAPRGVVDGLERLLERASARQLEPLVWPWTGGKLDRAAVGDAFVRHGGDLPTTRLLRHVDLLGPDARRVIAERLRDKKRLDATERPALLQLVGDPSVAVREAALEGMSKLKIGDEDAEELEALLSRKAGDLRRGVVSMLLGQSDDAALVSADRLLESRNDMQRLAGLELLRRLVGDERAAEPARRRAHAYAEGCGALTAPERAQLDAIAERDEAPPTLENALGLLDESQRTPPLVPEPRGVTLVSQAAVRLLSSLDAFVHEHRDERITVVGWNAQEETILLGDAGWQFPRLFTGIWAHEGDARGVVDVEQAASTRLQLRELWEAWNRTREASTRDADGFELVRALAVPTVGSDHYARMFERPPSIGEQARLGRLERPTLQYEKLVHSVCEWLAWLTLPAGGPDFVLDALETELASIPAKELKDTPPSGDWNWGHTWRDEGWTTYLQVARLARRARFEAWTREHHERLWRLERWVEKPPVPEGGRLTKLVASRPPLKAQRPPVEELLLAAEVGVASEADVLDHLLGPRGDREGFAALKALTSRALQLRGDASMPVAMAAHCRARVLEVELARGESPTAASAAALTLGYAGGLDVLVPLLAGLGRDSFVRGWTYDGEGRATVFSRLIRCTFPGETDSPERLATAVSEARLAEKRLVELAAFAPQWAGHVEHALGWPCFASAIWWLHGHTKDDSWTVEREVREAWAAEIAERTPLSAQDLVEGAVDVGWFRTVWQALGKDRWKALDAAARFCSNGGGHKRAQLFADAMRGTVDEDALLARIADKRHQDSVRAVGLLPLPEGTRDEVVLRRYEAIQEFVRGSRKFGSQRQASEKRAAEIGLANLARSAGYADPVRLGWAMEARGIADLADGPLTVDVDDVMVSLGLDDAGQPKLTVWRGETTLKTVPPAAAKNAEVKALRKRATELRRQGSRIRGSLELAMVRGDAFSGEELHQLARHPLLAPKLEKLVLVGDGIVGFPGSDGRVLVDPDGARHAVGATESVRIAHPVDLFEGGRWSDWQRTCLVDSVVQPFKQIFRELYLPTGTELDEATTSRRYAGHQLQPRLALALLGGRGWVAHPDEGVRKTFHDAGLTVRLDFLDGWGSPTEVEGLTLEEVRFAPKGEWSAIRIENVPRRIFSEVMRDLDLVVSVAHAGGVDPEASQSTIEMRSALLSETVNVLSIDNVRLDEPWALVDGQLGEYSVHLGSAVVHRRPGGSVCIVPVHGQHRGRLFLPFADDDPKTAEVVSKVLLLARDGEIRDPTILAQLR